ncbi:unnamed protein product [Mortierella alpina]
MQELIPHPTKLQEEKEACDELHLPASKKGGHWANLVHFETAAESRRGHRALAAMGARTKGNAPYSAACTALEMQNPCAGSRNCDRWETTYTRRSNTEKGTIGESTLLTISRAG